MEKKDIVFVDGLRVYKPNEKAPAFIKAELEFEMPPFIAWARQYAKGVKVRITIKESQKGTYYGSLNTFEPSKDIPKFDRDSQGKPIGVAEPVEEINTEDIPF